MEIYNQLVADYDLGKLKMDAGEEIDKLKLMFIGYALDAVDTAMRNFKIQLDFTEDSILNVEKILDLLNRTIERDHPTDDTILNFAKQFAGYIGQVMILKWGGEWKEEENYSIQNGPALVTQDQHLFLLSKVHRRIMRGPEENVYIFYQTIYKDIEGPSSLKEVSIDELTIRKKKSWIQKLFGK